MSWSSQGGKCFPNALCELHVDHPCFVFLESNLRNQFSFLDPNIIYKKFQGLKHSELLERLSHKVYAKVKRFETSKSLTVWIRATQSPVGRCKKSLKVPNTGHLSLMYYVWAYVSSSVYTISDLQKTQAYSTAC